MYDDRLTIITVVETFIIGFYAGHVVTKAVEKRRNKKNN